MGLHLIAAVTDPTWLDTVVNVLKVVIGLGMVIFVHELGHFAVAKLCGVKCEKFYIGFDFFGLKLWKRQYGETEYGIGVFPLGGYVKMLGQEDNPARLREEFERAKAAEAEGGGEGEQPEGEPVDLAAVEEALYDPRSYLAQSVPKRMAIISAGVIMNVIFALVMAIVAYRMGLQEVACAVGEVVPGKAAWRANMVPGDQIVEIAGEPVNRFQDLMAGVSLGDVQDGLTMVLQRPGSDQSRTVDVMPNLTGRRPTIGVGTPYSTTLSEQLPTLPGSAASKAEPALAGGDKVVKIGQVPVESYFELRRQLVLHMDEPLEVTVRRNGETKEGAEESAAPDAEQVGELIVIEVPPEPMRRLGLIMEPGAVTAVQDGSPAAEAGIRAGDQIRTIDSEPLGDPLTLDQRLRGRAGQTVPLVLQRDGEEVALEVQLRESGTYCRPFVPGSPIAIAPLGLTLTVLDRVAGVVPGSSAAEQEIGVGDELVSGKIIPPTKEQLQREDLLEAAELLAIADATVEFGGEKPNWAYFVGRLQREFPGTTVELTLRRGEEEPRSVTLVPEASADWFNPLRGFTWKPWTFKRKAETMAVATRLGYEETIDSLTLIWRSLEKLGSGQVSARELHGPVGIVRMAVYKAAEGTGELLIFLTILSANLAVINFLPIPVLDGGHMVFLAYEGITGKPPSERIFLTLSYLGLIFILGLMIWVIGLDVGRLLGG